MESIYGSSILCPVAYVPKNVTHFYSVGANPETLQQSATYRPLSAQYLSNQVQPSQQLWQPRSSVGLGLIICIHFFPHLSHYIRIDIDLTEYMIMVVPIVYLRMISIVWPCIPKCLYHQHPTHLYLLSICSPHKYSQYKMSILLRALAILEMGNLFMVLLQLP